MDRVTVGLRRLKSEHHSLVTETSELRAWWRTHNESSEFNYGEMSRRVMDLRYQLSQHISCEEEGGYLQEAARLQPEHAQVVAELLEEHKQFLDELTALADRLAKGIVSYGDNRVEPRRELEEILDRLSKHEETESRVLNATFGGSYR
jgi:hypothetical protein